MSLKRQKSHLGKELLSLLTMLCISFVDLFVYSTVI
jgi:hypothetical protein